MAPALRRLPLEWALLVALPISVLAVACSASWSVGLRNVAHPVRAAGLLVLAVLGVALAASRPVRVDRAVAVCAAAFLAVAAASVGWSVDPRHTITRLAGFGLLLVTAAALASAFAGDREGSRRLLLSLLAGAVIVALVGLGIAAVSPHSAVQAATGSVGERFRGVGQNPNTTSMLFAAALPLAALFLVELRGGARLAAAGALLLLAGSIIASGSHGAAAAACAGLLVFGLAVARRRVSRAAVVAGVAALALTAGVVTGVSGPLSAAELAKVGRERTYPVGSTERRTANDAQYIVRLEDEVDYSSGGPTRRSWFSSSGRVEAWRGAVGQAADRPLVGYGFGTEETVFVDRFEAFQGGLPENSFIGMLLQLGAVGLALFVGLLAALAVRGVRFLRPDSVVPSACLGVLAAGLMLAFVQSYLYVVGNAATLTVWVGAFLAAVRDE